MSCPEVFNYDSKSRVITSYMHTTRRWRAAEAAAAGQQYLKLHWSCFFLRGPQGAANGQDSWCFFKDAQGFGRQDAGSRAGFTRSRPPPPWTSVFQFPLFLWMLARAPASPAQGLRHHGPRYFNFPYFCTMCGTETWTWTC